ncbi:hypothetical protein [Bacillus taeanensis]|uniref:Uncharacterized protein n=1 Tax=Bacillus taeanensis TaxID=273032 RepID=A0A366XZL6_9BACI|nr:hypothetical protein [Bacillus taeanensis]RBW71046.1 hypothetical protein DS031_03375 [Bacillus taeanensis]
MLSARHEEYQSNPEAGLMSREQMRRYNKLFLDFQGFFNRPLTHKERNFIKWIVVKEIEVEPFILSSEQTVSNH